MKTNKRNTSPDFKNNVKNIKYVLSTTRFTHTKKSAFTLVELIVVITILAILGTIAFISLQGYSRDARDSTRLSDINNIEKQLELFLVKTGTIPIPENNIELVSSGVTIGYQGYADQQTLNILKVNNGGFDPVDQTAYTFRINASKRAYQIMGFLENGNVAYNFLSQANAAANLTNRFPLSKGKVLGIMLEQTTNNPLQDIKIGIINLRTDTTLVDTYLTNNIIKKGQIKDIYGTLENLARSQKFDKPKITCPTGFIKVPGNMKFGQPAFCAAKYEMSYSDVLSPTSVLNGSTWNTVGYVLGKIPVSMAGRYPIADITEQQAIDSCKSIGLGYHLITNNEWMSIARNIEMQSVNWNTGKVGSGFIYNGVSNSTLGCNGQTDTIYTTLPRNFATKTGGGFGNTSCDNKRKLTLSNQEQIWDLAGNIAEYVNKSNTIDGVGYFTLNNPILGNANVRSEWTTISSLNRLLYGPLLLLDSTNGIGKSFQGAYGREFIRSGHAEGGSDNGVFELDLRWTESFFASATGFRCTR